jgi:ABC-type proline/glycine betaine transport system, permease component
MEWLINRKIPVGETAGAVFDWLQVNGGWFFNGPAVAMERLIDGILWLLISPQPLVVVKIFVALNFALQRSWKVAIGVALGLLFIPYQDYCEETLESVTLVVSA